MLRGVVVLLGGHVEDCADRTGSHTGLRFGGHQRNGMSEGGGFPVRLEAGQAEVEHPGVTVRLDDDVRRFQVAVDHSGFMGVMKSLGHGSHNLDRGPDVRLLELECAGRPAVIRRRRLLRSRWNG